MVDTRDLKSLAAKRAGSSPAAGTNINIIMFKKIWLLILPVIIIINFVLAISNLISTRANNQMLMELINTDTK